MTKEERKAYNRQYYLNHKEEMIQNAKKWALNNPQKRKEIRINWNENNHDKVQNSKKRWRENNPEYDVQYNKTKNGRANKLITAYKISDKKYNRGECTLTTEWIVDNIFSKPCHYCGETDWTKIGCDRIDNSKPHIPDNCVPCCKRCNEKRGTKSYNDFLKNFIGNGYR